MNDAAREHLLGTTLDEFGEYSAAKELPAYRARQVFDWIYKQGAANFEAMTNLSKALRAELAGGWTIQTATEARRQVSSDGTTKLLLAWPDGATSECVLIPDDKRRTACISSQVGMSGRVRVLRQRAQRSAAQSDRRADRRAGDAGSARCAPRIRSRPNGSATSCSWA